MSRLRIATALALTATLSGCGDQWNTPANTTDLNAPSAYMLERQDMSATPQASPGGAARGNAARCTRPAEADTAAPPASPQDVLVLSPGDLLRVTLPGDEPPAGTYKVDSDGTVSFVGVGKMPATGRSAEQLGADLAARLVASGLYRSGHAHATVSVLERDTVRVMVAGAVFAPGQVTINQRPPMPDQTRQTAAGDHATGRALSAALANASGVRPDADIAHVTVERAGRRELVDLTGFIDGHAVNDVLLVDGDRVFVPSRNCFQAALARPTPITLPGVRVYISNLTTPATSNAQSGVGRDQTSLPYGTHLLQALFSANCVGGAKATNADRSAILVSTNPQTGESEVIERNIESLIRRADRDAYNPIVLPNDAIACYDSTVTNIREVLRSVGDFALSVSLASVLKP